MAAMLLGTLSTSAYDFMVDGIAYNKLSNNTDVSVSYLSVRWETQTPSNPYGDFEYIYYYNEKNKYSGYIEIPSVVNYGSVTYNVTSIAQHAFQNCSNLTSITIPESVTSIGNYAFKDCSRLASITLSENLTSIGYYAFENCSTITSVNIPESVTTINGNAFLGCSNLISITIPKNSQLMSIGNSAFYNCSSLTAITLPEGVTSIGDYAFRSCSSLTSITCKAVTPPTIGNSNTFYNVDKSIPVYVPAGSVNTYKAADYWKEFTNIQTIPTNDIASGTCGDNLTWKLTEDGELIIEGTGEMYDYSQNTVLWRNYTTSITKVTIKNGVTSIGDLAFFCCENLTSITISESVKSIGSYAFADCNSLTSITIPESVKSIDSNAFAACSSLASITLSEASKLTSIGEGAFSNCGSLTSITIPEDSKLTSIGESAFSHCSSLTAITLPEGVTSIGGHAFFGCIGLTSMTVAEGNTVYDSRNNCNAIIETSSNTLKVGCKSTIIPESVTSIGEYAFPSCSSLTSITIPENVTSIGYGAFYGCTGLTTITIPSSVTSIGDGAFYGCSGLTSITSHAATPPTIASYTFYNVSKSIPVYVPAASVEAYKSAEYWSAFTNIQPIEEPIPTVTITISKYGSGTYSSEYALDFSEVKVLKAYVATGYNHLTGEVTLLRVRTAQAATGLLIKGTPGVSYEVPIIESTADHTLNMLVATLEKTSVNSRSSDGLYANYKYTVVKEQSPEPMFYEFEDGSNLSAGKAYLQIPLAWLPTTGQKSIRYRFEEGETTDIEEEQLTNDNSQLTIIYDLYGRRVLSPKKGELYIINNKKVVY